MEADFYISHEQPIVPETKAPFPNSLLQDGQWHDGVIPHARQSEFGRHVGFTASRADLLAFTSVVPRLGESSLFGEGRSA
jgi:hypothetical protein